MFEMTNAKPPIELLPDSNSDRSLEKFLLEDPTSMEVAFQLVEDAIAIADASGCLRFLNTAAEELTGWSLSEARSLPLSTIFRTLDETTFDPSENAFAKIMGENRAIERGDRTLLVRRDNTLLPIEQSAAPIRDRDGQPLGGVLVCRGAKCCTPQDDKLSRQSDRDPLTGLLNRHAFEQLLEQTLSQDKDREQAHILCHLNLDRFKIINEISSHLAGDEFLRQITAVLKKRVRKSDILARLGGDEFGLLLYHCDLEPALKVIETLCEEVQKFQFAWEDKTFSFSLSVGLVLLKDKGESASSLLNCSRSACKVAKSKGRNRVHLYCPNDVQLIAQRGEILWLPRIFKALEENRFVLYHQPISPLNPDGANGGVNRGESAEVLLRLQDEDGQIVAPGAFIPAAEKHGLMHLVDRWVIETLLTYLETNSAKRQKLIAERGTYTVNLSGASLNDDQFLNFVKEQFSLHPVPPQIVCFEITETLAIANLNQASSLMHQLKAFGCNFALDDFGSGMSSFGYLKSLPVDYLKIDGIFIKDILHSRVACEIVEAINRIAHVMGIATVAECVESREVLLKLKSMGIDYAQGYEIAKPSSIQA